MVDQQHRRRSVIDSIASRITSAEITIFVWSHSVMAESEQYLNGKNNK